MTSKAFQPKKPHAILCGEPGISYLQDGQYYNQAYHPVAPPQPQKHVPLWQAKLDETSAERDALKAENALLLDQISRLLLTAPAKEEVETAVEAPSETIIVDTPVETADSSESVVVTPVEAPEVVETPDVVVPTRPTITIGKVKPKK